MLGCRQSAIPEPRHCLARPDQRARLAYRRLPAVAMVGIAATVVSSTVPEPREREERWPATGRWTTGPPRWLGWLGTAVASRRSGGWDGGGRLRPRQKEEDKKQTAVTVRARRTAVPRRRGCQQVEARQWLNHGDAVVATANGGGGEENGSWTRPGRLETGRPRPTGGLAASRGGGGAAVAAGEAASQQQRQLGFLAKGKTEEEAAAEEKKVGAVVDAAAGRGAGFRGEGGDALAGVAGLVADPPHELRCGGGRVTERTNGEEEENKRKRK
ncbi:hypothetical protein BT93_K0798 [Corymbia citriodora subsp. variegata]|nr:hypothetical protein BT93_K0798 [Corymbia citriodora subsp. variegata]